MAHQGPPPSGYPPQPQPGAQPMAPPADGYYPQPGQPQYAPQYPPAPQPYHPGYAPQQFYPPGQPMPPPGSGYAPGYAPGYVPPYPVSQPVAYPPPPQGHPANNPWVPPPQSQQPQPQPGQAFGAAPAMPLGVAQEGTVQPVPPSPIASTSSADRARLHTAETTSSPAPSPTSTSKLDDTLRPEWAETAKKMEALETEAGTSKSKSNNKSTDYDSDSGSEEDAGEYTGDKDTKHGYYCGVKCFSTKHDSPRRMTSVEKFIMFAQCAFAIVTAIVSILSYMKWDASGSMVSDFRANLNQIPFSDVTALTGSGSCPLGYEVWPIRARFKYTVEKTDSEGDTKTETKYVSLFKWRNARFCVKRMDTTGSALTRVRPDANGNCPSTYTRCSDYDCVPTGSDCPITSIELGSTSFGGGADEISWSTGSSPSMYWLKFNRGGNVRPLIDAMFNMNGAGVCLGQSPYANSAMSGSCSIGRDQRFGSNLDSYSLDTALANHGASSEARNEVDADDNIYLFQRSEIEWLDTTCDYTRQQAVDKVPILIDISNAQKAMMIVVIVAVVINLALSFRVYKDRTDWDSSNDNKFAFIHFVAGVALDALILGITIYALVKSETVRTFLHKVADSNGKCTDSSTQWMFEHFVEASDSVSTYNLVALGLRGAWVLYRAFKGIMYGEGAV